MVRAHALRLPLARVALPAALLLAGCASGHRSADAHPERLSIKDTHEAAPAASRPASAPVPRKASKPPLPTRPTGKSAASDGPSAPAAAAAPAPAPAAPAPAKAADPAAGAPPLAEARRGAAPVATPLDPSAVATQIEQSELQLRVGNVKGARDVLQQAVRAGSPEAMVAMARTYDPLELAQLMVPPGVDDVQTALRFYTDAATRGSRIARIKLDRLLAATANEPAKKK